WRRLRWWRTCLLLRQFLFGYAACAIKGNGNAALWHEASGEGASVRQTQYGQYAGLSISRKTIPARPPASPQERMVLDASDHGTVCVRSINMVRLLPISRFRQNVVLQCVQIL